MLKDKTIKIIAGFVTVFMFAVVLAAIFAIRGHSLYIKGEQIRQVSENQCMFAFINAEKKMIHIIIETPSPATNTKLLDDMKDDSVILLKSEKGSIPTGEVLAQVWVDGNQISCIEQP